MNEVTMRWYFKKLGGHIHVRCFSGFAINGTMGKNGDLVFDEREWTQIMIKIQGIVQVLDDPN